MTAAGLRPAQIVRLVAVREIVARLRSKAYRIATALMVLGVVAAVLLPAFADFESERSVAVPEGPAGLGASITAAAESAGEQVRIVDLPAGRDPADVVRAGEVDAVVTPGDGGTLRVLVQEELPDALRAALEASARQEALRSAVEAAGVEAATIDAAVAAAGVEVAALEQGRDYSPERIGLGLIAGIVVYVALLLYGQQVATGVVEEKTSRIVELILSTIRPWQLMLGKVLGIGLAGLAQLGTVAVAGLALALSVDAVDLPGSVATATVVWTLVWFVLGFTAYALLFAAVGALVSRQEEVGGVSAPVMFVIIAPYVLGASVLPSDPGNSLVATLSMVPLFAPTLMPMRVALGVPGWQLAVAVVGTVLLIAVLVAFAGRVYGNAVLRTGTRVRLRDALRAA